MERILKQYDAEPLRNPDHSIIEDLSKTQSEFNLEIPSKLSHEINQLYELTSTTPIGQTLNELRVDSTDRRISTQIQPIIDQLVITLKALEKDTFKQISIIQDKFIQQTTTDSNLKFLHEE